MTKTVGEKTPAQALDSIKNYFIDLKTIEFTKAVNIFNSLSILEKALFGDENTQRASAHISGYITNLVDVAKRLKNDLDVMKGESKND